MTRLGRQVDLVTTAFRERTGRPPEGVWAAPDRVSLIGEHTDYNDGFVLPVAIDRQVVAAAARRPDDRLRLWSLQGPEAAELHLADLGSGQVRGWAAYPAGVAWVLAAPWRSNDDRSRPPPSSPEAPMRLLVTGGAGYIGSVVGAQLVETGHQVTVLDNLSKGHRWAVPDGARFFQGDLEDRALLHRMLADAFDGVLHFAALSLVAESVAQPGRYYRNNVCGTLNLLDAMADAGVPRLVFPSTAAVYGQPEEVPIPETAPTRPTNPCGGSKLAVDQLISFACAAHGLAAVSLRYFNVAGASGRYGELHDPETHLIPIVLEAAVGRRDTVQVFGSDYPTPDGTAVRDYIHVEDLGRAHLLALEVTAPGTHRFYNLGNGAGFSVREVIEAARAVTGRPIPSVDAPRRRGDPPILVASSRRIHDELGWVPEKPELTTMIADAWAWMQTRTSQQAKGPA